MITQQNITDARVVADNDEAVAALSKANRDAFQKYIDQINENLWNSDVNPVPNQGPFTIAQAKLIDVILPNDYDYPLVFTNYDIQQRAEDKLNELIAEYDTNAAIATKSKNTYEALNNEYNAYVAGAQQIAANDPAVLAAKDNVAAAEIVRQTELDKKRMDQQNMKMILLGVGAVFGLVLLVALITRIR